MEKKQTCGDEDLPKGDLIQEILVRLPVESLLRFRSVCKSWYSLIQSSFFINLHTTFNSSSSSNKFGSFMLLASVDKYSPATYKHSREHSLIVLSSESGSQSESESEFGDWPWSKHDNGHVDNTLGGEGLSKDQVFKVEVDNNTNTNNLLGGVEEGSSSNSNEEDQQLLVVLKLKSSGVPSCYESCYFFKEIVGSCNGLVCLYDRIDNQVCLWNPATKLYRILPKSKHIGEDGDQSPRHVVVAFGFDGKDYKVVLLTGFRSMIYRPGAQTTECLCKVQVYSLSTNSWRLLEQSMTRLPGDPFPYPNEGLYLNGSFFFMAKNLLSKEPWELGFLDDNDRLIISFDFTKEIFTVIQIPEHGRNQKLYLSCLSDEIALFTKCYHNETHYEDYNIWVLKEHGDRNNNSENKESWTKLHSFQIEPIRPGECNLPIVISNDGEFALLNTSDSTGFGKKMKLYHLATKEVKMNFLSCTVVMSKAIAYKPSLVSIIGGNGSSGRRRSRAADRVIGNGATNP